MALDPATVLGFATGEAGSIPLSGSVRLKKPSEPREVAAFNALCFLRDRWEFEKPELVCIENFLNPAAQKSADAIILQIQVFGVIVAMCQAYSIPFKTPERSTILKHFIGRGRTGSRDETKRTVIQRAKALGYMPQESNDDNRADAIGAWSYAECHYARVQPRSLVLFGESAA